MFALLKNWSIFWFLFLKMSFSLQKEEDKKTYLCVKNWSNFAAQHLDLFQLMLGPVFKHNMFCIFALLLKPLCLYCFQQNMQLLKTRKDTICEHTCANCSCENVRFFFIFHGGFRNFQFSEKRFLDRWPTIKTYQNTKAKHKQRKTTKLDAKQKKI